MAAGQINLAPGANAEQATNEWLIARVHYLVSAVNRDYLTSTNERVLASAVRSFCEELRQLPTPAAREFAFVMAVEYSKWLDPIFRRDFLRGIRQNLEGKEREHFRDYLLAELWGLAVRDRESLGYELPRDPRIKRTSTPHERAVNNLVQLASKERRVSNREFAIEDFPSLALAVGILDSEVDRKERFLLFTALKDLGSILPKEGRIYPFYAGSEIAVGKGSYRTDGLFGLLRKVPIGKVRNEDGTVDDLNPTIISVYKDAFQESADVWRTLETHQKQINKLYEIVSKLEKRVDTLERVVAEHSRLLEIVFRTLEDHEKRLHNIEDRFRREDSGLNTNEEKELLDAIAPIVVANGPEPDLVMSPSSFVEGSVVIDRSKAPSRPLLTKTGAQKWTAAELAEWLKEPGHGSASFAIAPAKREGDGKCIFGRVHWPGEPHVYWVQYSAFFGWNETGAPGGHGNHEGDWICIDFQVRAPDPKNPKILCAIFHQHGKAQVVPKDDLDIRNGRVYVYLEKGTHEPHPKTGGERGMLEGWAWREHWGNAQPYDTRGKIKPLRLDNDDTDVQLVMRYEGTWGLAVNENLAEVIRIGQPFWDAGGQIWKGIKSGDPIEFLKGAGSMVAAPFKAAWDFFSGGGGGAAEVTNPQGVPYQPKMWNRGAVRNPADPCGA